MKTKKKFSVTVKFEDDLGSDERWLVIRATDIGSALEHASSLSNGRRNFRVSRITEVAN